MVRVIYIITMLKFCRSINCVHWTLTNVLEAQSSPSVAYYFPLHLSPNFTHRWDATEKVHFKISHSFIFRRPPEALGWELLFKHQPSPPLNLRIAIKWFSERDPEMAAEVEGTPRIRQLQEAVFHQVWRVYADVVHHVDVFNGLVLSLDEGGTAGTRLNGTLFRGLRAGGGREEQRLQLLQRTRARLWPPRDKGKPLAFKSGLYGMARFCPQAWHAVVGHIENQGPPIIFTLQLSCFSVRSFIKVADKLQQFLLALLNPNGRENKQCLIQRPGKVEQGVKSAASCSQAHQVLSQKPPGHSNCVLRISCHLPGMPSSPLSWHPMPAAPIPSWRSRWWLLTCWSSGWKGSSGVRKP